MKQLLEGNINSCCSRKVCFCTCTESCNKYSTHDTSTYIYILYDIIDNFVFLHVYLHCCMYKNYTGDETLKIWAG